MLVMHKYLRFNPLYNSSMKLLLLQQRTSKILNISLNATQHVLALSVTTRYCLQIIKFEIREGANIKTKCGHVNGGRGIITSPQHFFVFVLTV